MKWTMRYAALLAALVLSLGLVTIMQPRTAAAESDEVMLPSPNRGDPDSGGQDRLGAWSWRPWLSATIQQLSVFRQASVQQRGAVRTAPNLRLRTLVTVRR